MERSWDIWYSEEELALAHWIRYQIQVGQWVAQDQTRIKSLQYSWSTGRSLKKNCQWQKNLNMLKISAWRGQCFWRERQCFCTTRPNRKKNVKNRAKSLSSRNRQRPKAREFKPVKTMAAKLEEAAETKALIEEWLAAGNLPYIGQHGPKEKPKGAYTPAHGATRL